MRWDKSAQRQRGQGLIIFMMEKSECPGFRLSCPRWVNKSFILVPLQLMLSLLNNTLISKREAILKTSICQTSRHAGGGTKQTKHILMYQKKQTYDAIIKFWTCENGAGIKTESRSNMHWSIKIHSLKFASFQEEKLGSIDKHGLNIFLITKNLTKKNRTN